MIGKYLVEIVTELCKYELLIDKNLTVIKGSSGTGKTSICNLISQYNSELVQDVDTTVNIKINNEDLRETSSIKLKVLDSNPNTTEIDWDKFKNTIVFIDEDYLAEIGILKPNTRISKIENLVYYKDCYFVIITRYDLGMLSYSIDNTYQLKTEINTRVDLVVSKYLTKLFPYYEIEQTSNFKVDNMLCEDSQSGYIFFKRICKPNTIFSVGGKSEISRLLISLFCLNYNKINIDEVINNPKDNIYKLLNNLRDSKILNENYKLLDKSLTLFVDGSAFGYNLDLIMENLDILNEVNLKIIAPVSFEWLLCQYDKIKDYEDNAIEIDKPYLFADSLKYISLEDYYENNMNKFMRGFAYTDKVGRIKSITYNKKKVPSLFFNVEVARQIISALKKFDLTKILNEQYLNTESNKKNRLEQYTNHFE